MRFMLAVLLAGCGSEAGGDGGLTGCPGCAHFFGTCEQPEGIEAPCCPQGLTLTAEDCPAGTTYVAKPANMGMQYFCTGPDGNIPDSAPALVVSTSGRTRSYGTGARVVACNPDTGLQLFLSGECVSDCYGDDGAAVECRTVRQNACPEPDAGL